MSTEPTNDNPVPADAELDQQLRSFAMTLEAAVGTPLRPAGDRNNNAASGRPAIGQAADRTEPVTETTGRPERPATSRLVVWAVAAGLLLAAGFGLGAIWRDQTDSIDSVGRPEDQTPQSTIDRDTDQTAATDVPATGVPTTEPADTAAPQVEEPAVITDVQDGQLVEFTDGSILDDPPADATDQERRQAVVARAIVDELLRVEAFPGLDRAALVERLSTGGFTINTTLDPTFEAAALAAIEETHPEAGSQFEPGMVIINNSNRAVVAMTSRDPDWDGLVSTPRQTGSAFKTIVLAQAYQDGISPGDLIRADGPCTFTADGEPTTVGGSFRQEQTIAAVTRSSNNCAYMRLGQIVGLDRVAALADDLGVPTPAPTEGQADPPIDLPLGIGRTTAIDMAGAYAAFAVDGTFEEPWMITNVIGPNGDVIYRHERSRSAVMDLLTARLVTATLVSNVESGTGRRAQLSGGHTAAGKTGTTSQFSDAWFVGYTPWYTASVWLGSAAGEVRIQIPGWNSFGGGLPATVWGAAMDRIHQDLAPAPFTEPDIPIEDEPELLQVDGELPFCDSSAGPSQAELELQLVDSDNDGQADCVVVTVVED